MKSIEMPSIIQIVNDKTFEEYKKQADIEYISYDVVIKTDKAYEIEKYIQNGANFR